MDFFGTTRTILAPIQINQSGLYLLNTYLFLGTASGLSVENRIGYSSSTPLVHKQNFPTSGATTYASDGEILRSSVPSNNYSLNYSTVLYFNPGYICMAAIVYTNNSTAYGVVSHMRATRIG